MRYTEHLYMVAGQAQQAPAKFTHFPARPPSSPNSCFLRKQLQRLLTLLSSHTVPNTCQTVAQAHDLDPIDTHGQPLQLHSELHNLHNLMRLQVQQVMWCIATHHDHTTPPHGGWLLPATLPAEKAPSHPATLLALLSECCGAPQTIRWCADIPTYMRIYALF